MAYSGTWDPLEPDGSEPASTIDNIIRELKVAIGERLNQVIPDFTNDLVDPKVISGGAGVAVVGNTPGTPSAVGSIHYENDDQIISVGVSGTFRAANAGVWRADYDETLSAGNKASNLNQRMRTLVISCTKIVTDVSGFMQIDLTEINTKMTAVNSGSNAFTVANGRAVVATSEDPNGDFGISLARFSGTGIQLGFYDLATGLPLTSFTSAGTLGVSVIAYFAA